MSDALLLLFLFAIPWGLAALLHWRLPAGYGLHSWTVLAVLFTAISHFQRWTFVHFAKVGCNGSFLKGLYCPEWDFVTRLALLQNFLMLPAAVFGYVVGPVVLFIWLRRYTMRVRGFVPR